MTRERITDRDRKVVQQRTAVADFMKFLDTAMKFKKALQKKNLLRGRAKCPHCDGYLHGNLVKGRGGQVLHARCDGTCGFIFME